MKKPIMHLADFILENMDTILGEWEAFAATLEPASEHMTTLALRDHAPEILEAVARDITSPQTTQEQMEKSWGRDPRALNAPQSAAQIHAVLRAQKGFDINQLVAEYRALRASVLRLWSEANPLDDTGVHQVTRFNEAIDQAIAESVGHFHAQIEQTRNLLLGMLGHDMRSPLNAIVTTASYLEALNAGEQVSVAAERLIRSGKSMQDLLDDLVDFNRTQLGLGVRVNPSEVDLAAEVTDELEQLRAAHPDRPIELSVAGDTHGQWDGPRVKQVLRNLVSNACKYGSPDTPVNVALLGEGPEVRLAVSNSGGEGLINSSLHLQLFHPLTQGPMDPEKHGAPGNGLGLGLFIVREIVDAHGGNVDVHSDAGMTTFSVHLPRHKPGTSP